MSDDGRISLSLSGKFSLSLGGGMFLETCLAIWVPAAHCNQPASTSKNAPFFLCHLLPVESVGLKIAGMEVSQVFSQSPPLCMGRTSWVSWVAFGNSDQLCHWPHLTLLLIMQWLGWLGR